MNAKPKKYSSNKSNCLFHKFQNCLRTIQSVSNIGNKNVPKKGFALYEMFVYISECSEMFETFQNYLKTSKFMQCEEGWQTICFWKDWLHQICTSLGKTWNTKLQQESATWYLTCREEDKTSSTAECWNLVLLKPHKVNTLKSAACMWRSM